MPKFNGVSEQGKNGLLWTVFEGEPFSGRRVASFANQQEAWNYQEFRNNVASGEVDDAWVEKIADKHRQIFTYDGYTLASQKDTIKQAILEVTKDLMEDKKRLDWLDIDWNIFQFTETAKSFKEDFNLRTAISTAMNSK